MDVDGVIQIIPSLKGNTQDLPQEGMTLSEHKDDSQGGPKSEDLDQPEKELLLYPQRNVVKPSQDRISRYKCKMCMRRPEEAPVVKHGIYRTK